MVHIEEEVSIGNNINVKDLTIDLVNATSKFVNCNYECDVEPFFSS